MPFISALWTRGVDATARGRLAMLARSGRLVLPRKYLLRGWPVIEITGDAEISIGEGVLIDSRQRGYHVAMWGPVRLLADREGAHIAIGAHTCLHACGIHATESVTVGSRCLIAANVQIMDSSGHELAFASPERRIATKGVTRPVVIEDDVWIGTSAIILPGSHIGAGAVVSAGSVVVGRIPPRTLVRGNPAQPVLKA